ncbi:MAG TPA: alanine dehydrogenase [Euryarchaeota archaeon]|nr:alanine dehydrogenase [Euryarchaeota archaeon]
MTIDNSSVKTLLLSAADLDELLDMKEVISAVEEAFRMVGLNKVQMPPKMYIFYDKFQGDLRCMPSYIEELELSAVKIVNVHPKNPKEHGIRSIMGTILLIDPRTGAPISIMDGTYITDMRTGAASGIASKYLARRGIKRLGIIGAGNQARRQLQANLESFGRLDQVNIYDLIPQKSARFAASASEKYPDRIGAVDAVDSPREAVEDMDIVVTCTPSKNPIVMDEWVTEGQHFNCIGADAPGKQELQSKIMTRAKIVIDDWDQASHSGEINMPLSEGVITQRSIYGNIGDVVVGHRPGRESDKEITIFCSTGLAVQDAVTARLAFNKAKERGLGSSLELVQSR